MHLWLKPKLFLDMSLTLLQSLTFQIKILVQIQSFGAFYYSCELKQLFQFRKL